eukprot:1353685-Amorphochlora_amoeboformis.AAC.1
MLWDAVKPLIKDVSAKLNPNPNPKPDPNLNPPRYLLIPKANFATVYLLAIFLREETYTQFKTLDNV